MAGVTLTDHPIGAFALDVWGDVDLPRRLKAELALVADQRQAALLYHELGRIALARGDEKAGVHYLLKAYEVRPQFRPTLRLATLVYQERDEYTLVLKLLGAEARATGDPISRAALLRRHARLLWVRNNDLAGAREILEEAHRLDATDLATLKQLELIHLLTGDDEGRRVAIRGQLETVSDQRLRTALLVDLALLTAPADLPGGIETLRAAHRNEPEGPSVLLELEQLCELAAEHRSLAECLVAQAALPGTSARWSARLLARAARIHRDLTGDGDAAAALFLRSLEALPEHSVAADCFELLLARRRHADAVAVGGRLVELESEPGLRGALACQLGDLCRLELGEVQQAARWYQVCIAAAPSYQPALEGLGEALDALGDVDGLLRAHRADAAATEDPVHRARAHFRVAALLDRHDRVEEAITAHVDALAAQPGFPPSVAALERLYTRTGRWAELIQLYEGELASAPDPARQVYLLHTMAGVWHFQLADHDNAIECYRRILVLAPEHLPAIRAMARLCGEARRWRDLVDLNEREIALVGDTQRKAELLHRTGEVWEENVLDLDRAIACYRHALAINPEFLPALRSLGRLLHQKGRWADLCEMHESEIAITTDPEQALSLLFTIAEIHDEELLQEDRAAAIYRTILERRPGYAPASAALARILERSGQWRALVALLESSLDTVEDPRAKALRMWRIAAIREERLADLDGALRDYEAALRLDPGLAPVSSALAALLERTGDHQRLIELLTEQLDQTAHPDQRAALSSRLADLLERTGNPRKACTHLERALEERVDPAELHRLARLYQRIGMPREAADAFERLAAAVPEPLAPDYHLRVAWLTHRSALGDPAPHYRRAIDGAHGNLARRGLERYLREAGADADLDAILRRDAAEAQDPLESACLWTEVAEIAVNRQDPAAAEHAYREALARLPAHLSALWGLARLLEAQQRWSERAELAETEASVMESPRGIVGALLHAATLCEERLGDASRALPLYRRVLRVEPGHPEAYARLHRLLSVRADWADLCSLIRSQITATTDAGAVAALFTELGELYLQKLDQPSKGVACLRRALELEAYNPAALQMLGDLHFEQRDWAEAERSYARLELVLTDPDRTRVQERLGVALLNRGQSREALAVFRRAQRGADAQRDPALLRRIATAAQRVEDHEAHLDALEQLAEALTDPQQKAAARREIALVALDHVGGEQKAVRALREILEDDPLDLDAIERLAGLYGRMGDRAAVARHLQAAIAQHRAQLARRPFDGRLYRQLGRIFRWQRLFDPLYCACTVLMHLQLADDVEAQFWREHQQRCETTPAGQLDGERYQLLIVPRPALGPLRELLRELEPALQRITAAEPAQYGLSRSSRLAESHPTRHLVQEMATVLGDLDFDVWTSRDPELIDAAVFARPALILGARPTDGPLTAADRFVIGRALFLIAERAFALRDRSLADLQLLLSALGKLAQPECTLPLPAPADERQLKAWGKLLRKRERKLLGAVLPRFADALRAVDLAAFTNALWEGADRVGLLFSGDLRAGIDHLAQLEGETSDRLGDLLRYAVSDEHFALRAELGLAPGSG